MRVSKPPESMLPIVAEPTYLEPSPIQPSPIFDLVNQQVSPTLAEDLIIANMLANSGYFSDVKTQAEAFVKLRMGREIGVGPVTALREVYIIQGKVAMSANLMGALVKKTYSIKVTQLDNAIAILDFYKGEEYLGRSSFSIEDATKAGLMVKEVWKKWPRNMLYSRALSNGCRWYASEILIGAYTPDELTDDPKYLPALEG